MLRITTNSDQYAHIILHAIRSKNQLEGHIDILKTTLRVSDFNNTAICSSIRHDQ